jgi:hypothetical protein
MALFVYALPAYAQETQDTEATEPANATATQPAPAPRHYGAQRTVGIGPTAGWVSGLGGTLCIQGGSVGFCLSGGFFPVLVAGTRRTDMSVTFDAYGSAVVGADATFVPWHPSDRVDVGLFAGYRYDTLLEHGGTAGAWVTYDLNAHLAFLGTFGPIIFPDAQDRLVQQAGYPGDKTPSLPWLQGGANVGLLLYP